MAVDFARFVVAPQPGQEELDPITQALQTAFAFNQQKQLLDTKNANALGQIQARADLEEQQRIAEQAVQDEQRSMASRGFNLNRIGLIDDPIERRKQLAILAQREVERGGDASVIQNLMNIDDDDQLGVALAQQSTRDMVMGGGEDFAEQVLSSQTSDNFSSPRTEILDDGTTIELRRDGSKRVTDAAGKELRGDAAREAIQAANEMKLEREREEANIEFEKQSRITEENARIRRMGELKSEMGSRNREAARGEVLLNEALTLAQNASQGLAGSALTKLSRLLPDVDVSDEAALDAALKGLALEQLQKFKGPTTDFEFGVVQQIAGELGNSRSSNIARIKALKRNSWFRKEEFNQLRKFDGDPDEFAFDFQATKNFGDREYTLEQIQATAVANNWTIEETLKTLREKFGGN